MNSKLNSNATKHALKAYLAALSEPELSSACLAFARHSEALAPQDWERCLQALKQILKRTPLAVSNVNKLRHAPAEELSQLLIRCIRNEKFYDITLRILKIWLLTDKLETISAFLDAMSVRHSKGFVHKNEKQRTKEEFVTGIQAIRNTHNLRDISLYLRFILDVWMTSSSDDFWIELRYAVDESGIDITIQDTQHSTPDQESTKERTEELTRQSKNTSNNMQETVKIDYYQRILFGSPGTGKSHRIINEMLPSLGIDQECDNVIKTVFHPEYTYGDFVGKLLPITNVGKVEYRYYAGHFARALAKAYSNILKHNSESEIAPQKVALVIDEINRGNSSAIFGTAFQLLDREENGWSSYSITLSELEFVELLKLIGLKTRMGIKLDKDKEYVEYDPLDANHTKDANFPKVIQYCLNGKNWVQDYNTESNRNFLSECRIDLETRCVRIPPNLSIIGSMNTSDNSIYFMDSAFKRRWGWEFIDWDEDAEIPNHSYDKPIDETGWKLLVKSLNTFLKSKHEYIRGIEDKQIGHYFIKEWTNDREVSDEFIRNKLMFFVWDSVFQRDKKPLLELINTQRSEDDQLKKNNLVTFGDFCRHHNEFVNALLNFSS
jgi:5-methylcytosine-specific restriction protein B